MPISEKYVQSLRVKAYQDALGALESLILCTPSGPIRDKLTEANILTMECQDRQKQLDDHG
jgi:hypothetical protein